MVEHFVYGAHGLYLIVACVVAALIFVWAKEAARLLYSLIELVAGLVLLIAASQRGTGAFGSSFSSGFDRIQLSVTLIAVIGANILLGTWVRRHAESA
jgi:hypothetical protein